MKMSIDFDIYMFSGHHHYDKDVKKIMYTYHGFLMLILQSNKPTFHNSY